MLKEVDGFNGRYFVDEQGNIYSMTRKGAVLGSAESILKPADNRGYKRVVLRHKGDDTSHGRYVHRLVAAAFVENPDPSNLLEVNHINGDKSDNRAENLEWCSRKENIDHAWSTGLSSNTMNKGKGCTIYIGRHVTSGEVITVESKEGLSKKGFSPSCVIRCANGDRKTHKGYTWTKIKSSEAT